MMMMMLTFWHCLNRNEVHSQTDNSDVEVQLSVKTNLKYCVYHISCFKKKLPAIAWRLYFKIFVRINCQKVSKVHLIDMRKAEAECIIKSDSSLGASCKGDYFCNFCKMSIVEGWWFEISRQWNGVTNLVKSMNCWIYFYKSIKCSSTSWPKKVLFNTTGLQLRMCVFRRLIGCKV